MIWEIILLSGMPSWNIARNDINVMILDISYIIKNCATYDTVFLLLLNLPPFLLFSFRAFAVWIVNTTAHLGLND